jgi:hypothetical protein
VSTSTDALSDCTSHIGSNCSTRAPGFTNHWMTWHSVIPDYISSMRRIQPVEVVPSPMSASKYGLTTNRRCDDEASSLLLSPCVCVVGCCNRRVAGYSGWREYPRGLYAREGFHGGSYSPVNFFCERNMLKYCAGEV